MSTNSDSFPSPDTVASPEEEGEFVLPYVTLDRILGIITVEPCAPLTQVTVEDTLFDLVSLKKMITNQDNKVKIRPVLLALSGLIDSGKSAAIEHLLKHYVKKSPYMPLSRKSYVPMAKAHGITYYELLAYDVHRHLRVTEMTSEFSFAFGIMSAFKKEMIKNKSLPRFPIERSSRQDEKIFDDSSLECHLEYVFRHITQFEHIPEKATEMTEEETKFVKHLQSVPDGTSIINIWDTTINSTAMYFLHALSGHLYNSNIWLFLDIERDLDKLNEPPNHNPDEKRILKLRPRLHYLLRASKLSHGGSQRDRKRVATIFAKHGKIYNGELPAKIAQLEGKVQQVSKLTGVENLIESEVQPINLSDTTEEVNDYSQRLYQKFRQIICCTQYKEIPLAWVFLRSLFYQQKVKFISKSSLESKAQECGIDEKSFEEFCRFFTSFGSIIDFTLINPNQKIVILEPIEFLKSLDKILHPDERFYTKYPMMKNGIISESILCQEVFEVSCSDYMNVLVSIGLAAKVTGLCTDEDNLLTNVSRTDALYYVPHMCQTNIISDADPNAVYLITSADSPQRAKHAEFVKYMLELRPTAKLVPCPNRNRAFIHDIETDSGIEFISFSPAIMLSISTTCHEVYTSVIQACQKMLKPQETGDVKYQFVLLCAASDVNVVIPSSIPSCYSHTLPNNDLSCETCREAGRIDNEKLQAWNRALTENKICDKNLIKEELTADQMDYIVKAATSYPHLMKLVPRLAEVLEYPTDRIPQSFKDSSKLIQSMLLDWNMRYISENGSDKGSRRALAERLLEEARKPASSEANAENLSEEKNKQFFLMLYGLLNNY